MKKPRTPGKGYRRCLKPTTAGKERPLFIFSGDYSTEMWQTINSARTVTDLRFALYAVCCQIQELESELRKLKTK